MHDRHLRALADVLVGAQSLRRPALARRVGVSTQTVSDLMADLEQRGLVRVEGRIDGRPGRSALSYALRPDAALAMGFDVGATRVTGALIDLRGRVAAEMTEAAKGQDPDDWLHQVGKMADGLCARANVPRFRVQACVVGVPAVVHPSTGQPDRARADRALQTAAALKSWDICDQLGVLLGCPVTLENDVNLAMIGEVTAGVARGGANVAFLSLGSGLGAALLVNGQLVRGATGWAGEIGYLPFGDPDTEHRPPPGHFESVVSAEGIRARFRQLGGGAEVPARDILDLAVSGDRRALETVRFLARQLAFGIATLAALVDPELVILGGCLGVHPGLIDLIRTELADRYGRTVPLALSAVGRRAGLIGASECARNRLMTMLFGEPERMPAAS